LPISVDDTFRRALASLQANNVTEAERLFRAILTQQPRHIAGLNLLSVLLIHRQEFGEAEQFLLRALKESARSDATYFNYGNVLKALRRPREALEQYGQALAINPSVPDTWNNRGTVFNELGEHAAALADFDKALSLRANYPDALCNKGKALIALRQFDDALSAFDQALTLRPDLVEDWGGRGNVLVRSRRCDEALVAFDRAFRLRPELEGLAGELVHVRQFLCEWSGLNEQSAAIARLIREGKAACDPFSFLSMPSTAADQLACARINVAKQPAFDGLYRGERYVHERIRIAYLSADLHEHATSYLIAGLLEQHDRSAFEVTAVSFGPDQDSAARRRIRDAVGHFADVRSRSDQEIAEFIRQHEIDIAIDLKGFTEDARPALLARRPAPIQVNYLGYPGTLGASYIDYIIGDATVIPEDQYAFYDEKIVLLPHSYQPNDNRREISANLPTRADCGLPEFAFVFCCFNNSYKITPEIFDIWMRLLAGVDDSVLWLIEDNAVASSNLRREAVDRGISADRLIFAPRLGVADHLARHRHADLFLDTLPYNAHTTASDALWVGLPVLTCLGSTFAGRVAGSLLKAAGLDSLVTKSLEEYEALAFRLARDRRLLTALRDQLVRNRDICPLFDTTRFARYIEAAYVKMYELHQRGLMPQNIKIDP
jgi:predicted O-linked N-acetylglucosamine transferase (SPINDLY family)